MNIETIVYLLAYLIIYSFFGWVLESVAKTIASKKIVNSGFLYGPLCPIYGFGAIIMILSLNSLKNNILLLFLVSFIVLSIWEYIVGVLLEKIFKTKYWDYSRYKFNIKGRVCLKNSIFWGILGVIFIKVIHPFIEAKIMLIPINILIYCNVIFYIVVIVDTIITCVKTLNINKAIEKLNELEESIKEKLEEIRQQAKDKNVNLPELEIIIRDLKIKQTKLKIKLYKTTRRLKSAFPSMKSEEITNFFNEKLDLKQLKKYVKSKTK